MNAAAPRLEEARRVAANSTRKTVRITARIERIADGLPRRIHTSPSRSSPRHRLPRVRRTLASPSRP